MNTVSNHPADSVRSADGVSIRDLVPPVWSLTSYDTEPRRRLSVAVHTTTGGDGRMNAWLAAENQAIAASDVYQFEEKAWRVVAARRQADANKAIEMAIEAAGRKVGAP
jgi:hypothetical protein